MGWVGDVINFLVTSGLLAVVGRYIKKEGAGNILGKKFWSKEKYQEVLKSEIERNTEVLKLMDHFRDKYDLRSIDIVEFHNGDYINRKSVQKYTMTYQMCRLGVEETKQLYQSKPLEDHYGLLNLYKESDTNVVKMGKGLVPKDAPPLMIEKMEQMGISNYIALGIFKNAEDIYPRAIISCSLDDQSKGDGLDVELNLYENKFKSVILPPDDAIFN